MDDIQTAFFLGTEDTPPPSIADERAKRLRTLRTMAGLTREELCQPANAHDDIRLVPQHSELGNWVTMVDYPKTAQNGLWRYLARLVLYLPSNGYCSARVSPHTALISFTCLLVS